MFAHRAIAEHEVLQRVLQTEPDLLLPALTVKDDATVAMVAAFLTPYLARHRLAPGVQVEEAADFLARMVLSYMTAPGRWDLDDPDQVARLVRAELLGGILPPESSTGPATADPSHPNRHRRSDNGADAQHRPRPRSTSGGAVAARPPERGRGVLRGGGRRGGRALRRPGRLERATWPRSLFMAAATLVAMVGGQRLERAAAPGSVGGPPARGGPAGHRRFPAPRPPYPGGGLGRAGLPARCPGARRARWWSRSR